MLTTMVNVLVHLDPELVKHQKVAKWFIITQEGISNAKGTSGLCHADGDFIQNSSIRFQT